jgi:hypothetical protein
MYVYIRQFIHEGASECLCQKRSQLTSHVHCQLQLGRTLWGRGPRPRPRLPCYSMTKRTSSAAYARDARVSVGGAPSASASAPGGSSRRVRRTRPPPPLPPPPVSSGECRTPQTCRASACRSGTWAARAVPRMPPSTNLAARASAPQARRGEIRNDRHVRACSVRERSAGRERGAER